MLYSWILYIPIICSLYIINNIYLHKTSLLLYLKINIYLYLLTHLLYCSCFLPESPCFLWWRISLHIFFNVVFLLLNYISIYFVFFLSLCFLSFLNIFNDCRITDQRTFILALHTYVIPLSFEFIICVQSQLSFLVLKEIQ